MKIYLLPTDVQDLERTRKFLRYIPRKIKVLEIFKEGSCHELYLNKKFVATATLTLMTDNAGNGGNTYAVFEISSDASIVLRPEPVPTKMPASRRIAKASLKKHTA